MTRSSGRSLYLVLAVACAATATAAHACKDPTQVTVEITTLGFRCSELRKISIVVASDPDKAEAKAVFPQAEVTSCEDDHRVGTLVLTPAEDRGAVMVLASYTDRRCEPPRYEGCIVARRAFSFIDHVPLRLPIALEASCKDVPCNALSSCRSGQCVSSSADCHDDGTCAAPAQPVVAEDGGVVPPPPTDLVDAGPPNDGATPPDDVYVPPVDAGIDAPADAGEDVVKGTGYGNICPIANAPTDCFVGGQVCCTYAGYTCTTWNADAGGTDAYMAPACGGAQFFPCTGRLHCGPNEVCCGTGAMGGYAPSSACGETTSPQCSMGFYLCNTDDDCPGALRCNTVHFTSGYPDAGAIRRCGP